ncbi:glycosyltransferase family 4 protein [Paenibacillus odorifer]|nr:glycosyltransferase family 4 protein [Paenibacillus odorifer]
MPDPRVEKEVNSLINKGYKVKILSWDRMNDSNNTKNGEIKLGNGSVPIRWFNIKASFGGGLKTLKGLFLFQISLLFWLIKHNKEYDLVHACDFDTVLPARICTKVFKKKIVYDIFDYYIDSFQVPKILKPLIEKIDILIMNSVDAVIITNESRLEQIKKSNPKKIVVIHNSPEEMSREVIQGLPKIVSMKNKQYINKSDKIKLVYVGILSYNRFLLELLEIIQTNSRYELHIAGFGPYEANVENSSKEHENILFYGKIPYNQVLNLEEYCDVLFAVYNPSVPNHKYSSPNKLYEAMMLGKPIIVARDTGIDQLVEKFDIGKVVDYEKGSFNKALSELAEIQKEKWDVKERSQKLFFENYSWKIMSERLSILYSDLLKSEK